jgi:hypothetical protein
MTQPGMQSRVSMHIGQWGDAGAVLFGGVRVSRHCTQVGGVVGCGMILPCAQWVSVNHCTQVVKPTREL